MTLIELIWITIRTNEKMDLSDYDFVKKTE